MEATLHPDAAGATPNPTAGAGTLSKAVTSAHGAVDRAAALAEETLRKARPAIDRVADGAHLAVDRAAGVAAPTAEWMRDQRQRIEATGQSIVTDARQYVLANPLKSLTLALAAGILIGRILRILR